MVFFIKAYVSNSAIPLSMPTILKELTEEIKEYTKITKQFFLLSD
jgi:hypothetical protein